jgi:hypothetical protein
MPPESLRLILVNFLSRWQKFPLFPRGSRDLCAFPLRQNLSEMILVPKEARCDVLPKPRIPNILDRRARIRRAGCRFFLTLKELWSFTCTYFHTQQNKILNWGQDHV